MDRKPEPLLRAILAAAAFLFGVSLGDESIDALDIEYSYHLCANNGDLRRIESTARGIATHCMNGASFWTHWKIVDEGYDE